MKCSCPNCDWSGDTSELDPVGIDVFQRMEPGDTFPNGECPECEALVSIAEPLRDAAPDLLSALEMLLESAECLKEDSDSAHGYHGDPESFKRARSAIAKAKGGAK